MAGEPERSFCPGDPHGHLWQLQNEEAWYEAARPMRASRARFIVTLVLLLIPVAGWMALWAIYDPIYRGRRRTWYCTRCRVFDETREPR